VQSFLARRSAETTLDLRNFEQTLHKEIRTRIQQAFDKIQDPAELDIVERVDLQLAFSNLQHNTPPPNISGDQLASRASSFNGSADIVTPLTLIERALSRPLEDECTLSESSSRLLSQQHDRLTQKLCARLNYNFGNWVTLFGPIPDKLSDCFLRWISVPVLSEIIHNNQDVDDSAATGEVGLRTLREGITLHDLRALPTSLLNKDTYGAPSFWVDEKRAHLTLAVDCIQLMSNFLKEDICGVGRPGARVGDGQSGWIDQFLPPRVQYACLYWIQHLQRSGAQLTNNDRVHQFLNIHVLHWLEALGWMRRLSDGIHAINLLDSLTHVRSLSLCPKTTS
jgi:hypothetical protein